MEYQSLYRRFRPGRFSDIIGQEHVVRALRNAVRENRVGHAYLLSGPRGTGKTTAARVLAKVLNCETPIDGEPCGECASCKSIENGTSFDLHELDAASHNKVDDIRDLLSKVHLGTPGRSKVYLLDEVHMLTAGAENALLKTLEEPPDHVVFVLATTEPHKVVPTIRSRTQHLELSLVPAEEMTRHVWWIAEQANLDVDDAAVAHVVRVGGGSVRDTLSALDQVVAAGGVARPDVSTDDLVDSLATADTGKALAAVNAAMSRGTDPRIVGEQLIRSLRDVFLAAMGADTSHVAPSDRDRVRDLAGIMRPAVLTRAMEMVGTALVDMRQSPDPRIDLEVALVRLTRPETDHNVAALAARVEQLEAAFASGVVPVNGGTIDPSSRPAAVSPPAVDVPPTPAPVVIPPRPDPDAPAPVTAAAEIIAPAVDPDPPASSPAEPSARVRPADAARQALASRSGRPSTPDRPSPSTGGPDQPPPIPPRRPSATPRPASEPAGSVSAPPPPAPADPVVRAPIPGDDVATGIDTGSSEAPSDPAPTAPPETAPVAPLVADTAAPVDSPVLPPPPAGDSGVPSQTDVEGAWEQVLPHLSKRAALRVTGGRFVESTSSRVVYALPHEGHRKRCEEVSEEISAALTAHFDRPVRLALVVDGPDPTAPQPAAGSQPREPLPADDDVDLGDLVDAAEHDGTVLDRLTKAFPGAELMTDE